MDIGNMLHSAKFIQCICFTVVGMDIGNMLLKSQLVSRTVLSGDLLYYLWECLWFGIDLLLAVNPHFIVLSGVIAGLGASRGSDEHLEDDRGIDKEPRQEVFKCVAVSGVQSVLKF
jgi:hypothetical protein